MSYVGIHESPFSFIFRAESSPFYERRREVMILFTILLLILLILVTITVIAISVGGSVAIVLFGDVFVCIFIIVLIMRRIIRNR